MNFQTPFINSGSGALPCCVKLGVALAKSKRRNSDFSTAGCTSMSCTCEVSVLLNQQTMLSTIQVIAFVAVPIVLVFAILLVAIWISEIITSKRKARDIDNVSYHKGSEHHSSS